jgi:hypothetical protein
MEASNINIKLCLFVLTNLDLPSCRASPEVTNLVTIYDQRFGASLPSIKIAW